ncbi:MAG TPA: methylmalonyl-CoA carboxyltransferase [Candidatus Pullichristensenella stercorigallinarum]|uniref:Methylmalonyl-CoA carboxyltransferase n=1 Tax=Candidatus Pullichristensenella stercorigallinarum TaxID=2840909 RepID=A0A9D0ZMZ5_9FIRM|nr:methylmalonyl-CoA carboxyltransferase [Candidatus Pullichristensenella stercorigallinarum]
MSVERNLPIVRERKLAILKGDPELCDKQKKAGKLLARERVAQLLDAASFVELDVLNAEAGVVTGYGLIDEKPVYVYAQDFTVKGGSVGAQHAKKILKVMELAEKTGAPLVAILDTAGARLDEGLDAMNAYAMIAGRVSALSGVVPQVALVLGQCGGIASAIAGMSDFVVMSKNGSLFVNGPRVVSAVAGKQLDMEAIGGSSASVRSGMAQLTAETDEEAIAMARKVVAMLPANNMDEAVDLPRDDMNRELPALNAIEKLDDVRDLLRGVADLGDIVELGEEFAPSMVTALGKIGGTTVGFIANQAAKDEGRLTVYGCKKAARFAAFCDCFSIPIITVVDSMGMKISTAPQGELSRAGAQLLFALSEATTPRVALVVGQAIGMSYASLASRAVSDMVYAWPGSVFSPVSAQIAAQLLYADEMQGAEDPYAKRAELEQRYMDDVADAVNAAKQGYVDDVIEPAVTRQMLCSAIEMLSGKRDSRPAKKHGNMPL